MKQKELHSEDSNLLGLLVSFVLLAAIPVGTIVGWHYGHLVPFSEQWPLYEALRTTAAIIFAVVGAWFAIIYPERMKGVFNKNSSPLNNLSNGMEKLFSPVFHSTIILCIILVLGVIAPVLKRVDFLMEWKDMLRSASFSLLVALTLWQVWTVLVTLIPAFILKTASQHQTLQDDNHNTYFANKTVKKDPENKL